MRSLCNSYLAALIRLSENGRDILNAREIRVWKVPPFLGTFLCELYGLCPISSFRRTVDASRVRRETRTRRRRDDDFFERKESAKRPSAHEFEREDSVSGPFVEELGGSPFKPPFNRRLFPPVEEVPSPGGLSVYNSPVDHQPIEIDQPGRVEYVHQVPRMAQQAVVIPYAGGAVPFYPNFRDQVKAYRKQLLAGAPIPLSRVRKYFVPGAGIVATTGGYRRRSYGGARYYRRSYRKRPRYGYGARRRYYGRGSYLGAGLAAGAASLPYLRRLLCDDDVPGRNPGTWGPGNRLPAWGSGAYGGSFGAQSVKNSDAVNPNSRLEQALPTFSDGDDCIIVKNEEYLGDIKSPSAVPSDFQLQISTFINPGNNDLFPWLARVASCFQQYEFKSLIFTYKSMSGALSTTQALGQVMMSTQYNVYEPAPTTKQEALNTIFAVSKVPSEDVMHAVECERAKTTATGLLFIRGEAVPAGQDQRFYDLGRINVATGGQSAANINLGQVWVSYEVKLCKPQMASLQVTPENPGCLAWRNTAPTSGVPLGSGVPVMEYNGTAITVDHVNRRFLFPADVETGNWLVQIQYTGDANPGGGGLVFPTLTVTAGNYTLMSFFSAANVRAPNIGDADTISTAMLRNLIYKINGPQAPGVTPTIELGVVGVLPITNASVRVMIQWVPANAMLTF